MSSPRLGEVADTVRLYNKMKLGPIGALAIVASTENMFSYAQAFLRAATADRPVRLFRDVKDARAWVTAIRDRKPSE